MKNLGNLINFCFKAVKCNLYEYDKVYDCLKRMKYDIYDYDNVMLFFTRIYLFPSLRDLKEIS